tara:strand:- start:548 stop:889 length:342 start_codon:yes stop_codon:yes gene_type:complete
VRNNGSDWGGCYIQIYYDINSSGWKSIGSSGFVNVMEHGASIGLVNISYLLDINLPTAYTCQFKAEARAYNSTLYVNIPAQTFHTLGDTNSYGINRYLNYTRLTVTEYGPNPI